MKKTLLAITLAVASTILSAPAAFADDLTLSNFTLTSPNQTTVYGPTVTYDATVTASASNTGDIYFNGDFYSGGLPVDDSPFFNTFPISLAPGQSYTGPLFIVDVPAATYGTFDGSFQIYGGGPTDNLLLGSVDYSTVVTPEGGAAAAYLLLAGAICCCGIFFTSRNRITGGASA